MFDINKKYIYRSVYANLDNGEIVEYTEWLRREGKPTGNFDDFVFLGTGKYHHSE